MGQTDTGTAIMVTMAVLAAAVLIGIVRTIIRESRHVTGTVVAKDFEPSRFENTVSTQVSGDGTVMPIAGVRRIPDRWILSVEPAGGGSRVTRTVSRSRWKEIEVGDHWED